MLDPSSIFDLNGENLAGLVPDLTGEEKKTFFRSARLS